MENSFEFAVGLVNFVLLLFLLKPILIDPLRNVAREREEKARINMQKAEEILAQAKANLEKYQTLQANIAEETAKIAAKAEADCEVCRKETAEKCTREVQAVLDRAHGDAEASRAAAVAEIRHSLANETVKQAEAIIKKGLGEDDIRQNIIENFLAKVGAQNAK